MNPPGLDAIRDCLEGATPGILATCSPDGTPNVSYLSQIHYVDARHIALSFQFFNKTRQNVLANPQARLQLMHPLSSAMYRLQVRYLRTETQGALFEAMKAKLAGIASHTGMAGVFRLLGSDVYEVLAIEAVHTGRPEAIGPRRSLLAPLRASVLRLSRHAEFDALLAELLGCLAELFDVRHAMVLMLDGAGGKLYTVASHGYSSSGVGSEVPLGAGVIGVAARERTPIRISHMTSEYAYGRAIRDAVLAGGQGAMLETEIPLPGLPRAGSQLAVPIAAAGRLAGVLFVESPEDLRFGYDDEDALVTLAAHFGVMLHVLQTGIEQTDSVEAPDADAARAAGLASPDVPDATCPVRVRHYRADHSVFLDDHYLIKGVAGAILWALLSDHVAQGRVSFSNRELRLDPRIRLPDISDNLEARLVLLQRRLAERDACIRLERAGRGRLRLLVRRALELIEIA
jgi:adenylate cyclase